MTVTPPFVKVPSAGRLGPRASVRANRLSSVREGRERSLLLLPSIFMLSLT